MTRSHVEMPTGPRRDLWVLLGLIVSATSAAVSCFDGLRSLAMAAGWSVWMAPLLPLTIDSFATTATRVWLTSPASARHARRLARRCAVGAVVLSLAGNAVWHLVSANLLAVNWIVVLAVGAVPPLVLSTVTHLAVLRRQGGQAEPNATDAPANEPPAPDSPAAPQPPVAVFVSDEELLAAARAADSAYRATHDDKGITRDELRRELGIGVSKASSVLRRLRAEQRDSAS